MWDLPHSNSAWSSLKFTPLTFLFIQGLSCLQKSFTNLTFMLFELSAVKLMSFSIKQWQFLCRLFPGPPTVIIWSQLVRSLPSFPGSSMTLARGALGLKILVILYSVPRCSLSMGPISLPLLLLSKKIFLFWFSLSPASGFTLFSTCFKKPVLRWSTSSTLTLLLSLTWGTSSAQNLQDPRTSNFSA